MSKLSGRTGHPARKYQALRPETKLPKKDAFDCRIMVEPPRLKRLKTCLLGRSPLRAFYYTKGVRGRWNTADRIMRGTRWNAYLCYGLKIPKFQQNAISRAPPVKGLLADLKAPKERAYSQTALRMESWEGKPATPAFEYIQVPNTSPGGWLCGVNLPHCDVHAPAALPVQEAAPPFIMLEEAPGAPVAHESIPQPAASAELIIAKDAPQIESVAPSARIGDIPITIFHTSGRIGPLNLEGPMHMPTRSQKLGPIPLSVQQLPEGVVLMQVPPAENAPAKIRKIRARRSHRLPSRRRALQLFRADAPRTESIRFEAMAAPEERNTIATILMPAQEVHPRKEGEAEGHIGYIPSARKKVVQLKVAQGSDALPPQ